MRDWENWYPEIVKVTEHFIQIKGMDIKTGEMIYLLERLHSLGYRFVCGNETAIFVRNKHVL